MDVHKLQAYLNSEYQGEESFLETIIFPIFGEENYETAWQLPVLEDEELHGMAARTGIKDIIKYGTISIGHVTIDIFDVTVSDSVQMQRNRVGIQQLIRRIMNTYSSAFIIFHYRDNWQLDWRFSFCQKDDKNITEAKRYTFLLGPGQSCRTAAQNFMKLLGKNGNVQRDDIVKAFDVEALSDEFFKKYKDQYEKFVMFITGKKFVKKDGGWKEKVFHEPHPQIYADFGCDDKRVRDYIKKLLGRIVFLHFLQKKGWMGVVPDKSWNEGDKNFMYNLFHQATELQQENFLDEILEPLFNALDTDRGASGDIFDTQVKAFPNGGILRIPYLNGGLFGRDEDDEVLTVFPKEYFSELLTMFNQYNFTIDENDPTDAEVGIDPEMLGQIFENLLEDNKDKGAYYTPKEIVRYMCKESLISYLQNDFPREHREQIREFVTSYNIDVLPADIIEEIDRRLISIKICDPAIGSGAFPMGLLKELFFCRGAIENFDNSVEIKRHIIQENIYGVDLEKGAVDIARLRFWLTLVVDEVTPEVLPNLDYKIMQGNSLFTTFNGKYVNISDSQVHTKIDDIRKEKQKLRELQKQYFYLTGDDKLKCSIKIKHSILNIVALQLLADIDAGGDSVQTELFGNPDVDLKSQLMGSLRGILVAGEQFRALLNDESISLVERAKLSLPFFDYKVMFSDAFDSSPDKNGFDIVIGNPPYGAKLNDNDKTIVKKFYNTTRTVKGVQKGSMDSYTLFIELAYWLLRKDAFMAYIVPISLTSSDSLSGVHKLLLENCRGIKISSYSVRPQPVFKNAVVNTSILMFQKTKTPCKQLLSTKMHRKGRDFDLQTLIDTLHFTDVLSHLKLFGRIPKIGLETEKRILDKVWNQTMLVSYVREDGSPIFYRTTGGRYFKIVTNYSTGSTKEKAILFEKRLANAIGCILSSNLSFWYYQIISNNLDWKSDELLSFTIPNLTDEQIDTLNKLYDEYQKDVEVHANVRQSSGDSKYNVSEFKEYKIVKSKAIIDLIDDYICPLYGLTPDETEFIKNYELEFRMAGDE